MKKVTYTELILGMSDPGQFAIAFAFGLVGILLSLLLQSTVRDKHSMETPYIFSWSFLLKDNLQRIVTSILLLFVGIRFAKELMGQNVTMYVALVIGFGLDKVSQILKNKTLEARK